jgi:predicted metal-binding membrane protein
MGVTGSSAIERALKQDRAVVISALVAVIVASWLYVFTGAGMGMSAFDMSSLSMASGQAGQMEMSGGMSGAMQAMATPVDWTIGYAVLMFCMWWVMMIAMMLPSAAPMILLHAMVDRKSKTSQGGTPWRTAAFTAGYLAVWAFFSATAAGLQWAFEGVGLLTPMAMSSNSALFAAAILLFAGLYQLTPIKQACLKHCRGPIQFLARHWRPGAGGAFLMGIHHGAYCLGCCWGLMAILFFGGIMNLYWIIGLAVIVLLEKLMPVGPRLSVVTGGLFLAWGVYFLYSGVV